MDPTVGDRIGAVTAMAPSKGLASRRDFVDLNLLPSAQGLAFEPVAEDLAVSFDSDWVRISRPKGLTLSSPAVLAVRTQASMGLPQPAAMPGLIDYVGWSRTGAGGFMARYNDLQNQVADEINREAAGDKGAGVKARMGLARFLAGSELSYEAIGVLNLTARAHPEMMGDPEFRGIRGAARAMAGRYKEAENDFSVPVLADDPASALWRGYIAAKQSDWMGAKEAFVHGMAAMNQFSPAWQARFARAYAETALQLGELDVASTEIALSLTQTKRSRRGAAIAIAAGPSDRGPGLSQARPGRVRRGVARAAGHGGRSGPVARHSDSAVAGPDQPDPGGADLRPVTLPLARRRHRNCR